MIDVANVSYNVIVVTENNAHIDITNAVESLGWEENDGELAMKLTFDLFNAELNGSRISSVVKIGCLVAVQARWGSGSGTVAYCKIIEAEVTNAGTDHKFRVVAYDCLYDLQKSQDNVYFPSGKKTKYILTAILKSWSLKIDKYTGADVKHSKVLEKNKNLSDIILSILSDAKKKGGTTSIIRADKGKIQILKVGSNSDVYVFTESNSTSMKNKRSVADIVTRVRVVSSSKSSSKAKIEATVNGKTEYGIRQKIVTKSKSEKLSDAKKEAKEILSEKGNPQDTRELAAPDVPCIRKGDKVCVSFGKETYYIVKSIQHNANKKLMTMKLDVEK